MPAAIGAGIEIEAATLPETATDPPAPVPAPRAHWNPPPIHSNPFAVLGKSRGLSAATRCWTHVWRWICTRRTLRLLAST